MNFDASIIFQPLKETHIKNVNTRDVDHGRSKSATDSDKFENYTSKEAREKTAEKPAEKSNGNIADKNARDQTTHNVITPKQLQKQIVELTAQLKTEQTPEQAVEITATQLKDIGDYIRGLIKEATTQKPTQEQTQMELVKILAANPEIEQEVQDMVKSTGLDVNAALIQTLILNQKALDDVIAPLSDGVITAENIENGSSRLLNALLIEEETPKEIFVHNINVIKAKIKAIQKNPQTDITTANLTPEDLTRLQELAIAQNIPEDLMQKLAGLAVNLVPQTTETPINFSTPAVLTQSAIRALIQPLTLKQQNFSLNNNGATFNISEFEGSTGLMPDASGKTGEKGKNTFDALLKDIGNNTKNTAIPAGLVNFNAANPLLTAAFDGSTTMLDQYGLNTSSALPSTLGHLTAISTQAASAGASHPATQMVAIKMQKMAGSPNDGGRSLSIQLDPPDLGRVEVRMDFGKDKSVKATVTSERPETHLMMQRDAQLLERALQDAGLDADSGLSFELAEHGFDFDQDNQRGGGHDGGGTGANNDGEPLEIIETTMNWHFDPESGMTRYDIWA